MKCPIRLVSGLALAGLLLAPPAHAFEVCMEGGPWLSYYLSELEAGHFERVVDLTTPLPGQDRAAVLAVLSRAQEKGALDRGRMSQLTIEGECVSDTPEMLRIAAMHGLTPESLVGYRLGRAWVMLTIIGPPDWFNFVAADLGGL